MFQKIILIQSIPFEYIFAYLYYSLQQLLGGKFRILLKLILTS